jgi:type IV secretion system protein VirD4
MQAPDIIAPRKKTSWASYLFLLVSIIGLNSASTQYLAGLTHFHSSLGQPLIGHVYHPFAWMLWQFQYYSVAKHRFDTLDALSIGGYFCILLIFALMRGSAKRNLAEERHALHGSAHWASEAEIKQTGLLAQECGVSVGAWTDQQNQLHLLRHNGPEHVVAIAPTRSGKGVGLVVPTLLTWPASCVIHDMKGELWALTAGWRSKDAENRVLKFDPAAVEGSCAFNPLAEIRLRSDYEVGDTQNLVTMIVDPDGKGLSDHWSKTAHAFLTGVILHCLYQAKTGTIPALYDVAMAISDPNRESQAFLKEMLETGHPTIAAAAREMLNREEVEQSSVLSSALSYLSLYRDPLVAKNTQRSDFRIRDLMNADKPVSLYLVVRPADKDRLKPLMRLLINQIVRVLTREEIRFEQGATLLGYQHRLLLMLDEFPSFGKLEVFQEALAFIAGYGINAYLIMQDITQLRAVYGHDESILSNCHIRIAYAPNKPETAEWLSKMAGTTTITVEDVSNSGKRFGLALDHMNQSHITLARPLLTPDECMRLPGAVKHQQTGQIIRPGAMLIFVAGHAPIYGTQPLYFQDPKLKQRASIPLV